MKKTSIPDIFYDVIALTFVLIIVTIMTISIVDLFKAKEVTSIGDSKEKIIIIRYKDIDGTIKYEVEDLK
jgi:hypothetical protein